MTKNPDADEAVALAAACSEILVGHRSGVIGTAIAALLAGYARTTDPENTTGCIMDIASYALEIVDLNKDIDVKWVRKPTRN